MKANSLIELFGNQIITDYIITALEGGSNDWYNLHNTTMVKKIKDMPLSERIALSVLEDETIKIPVSDIDEYDEVADEEDVEVLGYISKENIENGIELYIKDGRAFSENDYDAGDADVFLQFVVLGEIVYG